MNTFIVFPFLVLTNLRKFCGLKVRHIILRPRMKIVDLAIARCLSYYYGKRVIEYTSIEIKLDEKQPIPDKQIVQQLLLLRYAILSENGLTLQDTTYTSFVLESGLITSSEFYIHGFENCMKQFLAIPVKCERLDHAPYHHIDISNHAKNILKGHRKVKPEFYKGIERFNASFNELPFTDYASQIINLAAGFECILDLEFNSSGGNFKNAIATYYDDELFIQWAMDFYNLRSSIHHGFRLKSIKGSNEQGRLIETHDFDGNIAKCKDSPLDILSIGKEIFSGIANNILTGKKVNYKVLRRTLVPNSEILTEIRNHIKINGHPSPKFIELVNALDLNDSSGSKKCIKFIITSCLDFLISQDRSLEIILEGRRSLEIEKQEDYYTLSLFRDILKRCDLLKNYVGQINFIGSDFDYKMIPFLSAVCDLFTHFAHISVWRKNETGPRHK